MWITFITLLLVLSFYKLIYLFSMYIYHKLYSKNKDQEINYYTKLYDWVQSYISLVKW